MKISALNGSPQGKKSTTYIMIEEFLQGAKAKGAQTEHIILAEKKIHHCMGCLTCWFKTKGICIFDDDMDTIDVEDTDIILFASPLYVDNISGLLKNYMDRRFAKLNPRFIKDANGETIHPKNSKKQKLIVMANCGYPGQNHFIALQQLFYRIARNKQSEMIAEIFRDEGPLLKQKDPTLGMVISDYKKLLQKAGREIVQYLKLSEATKAALKKPLIPYDVYIEGHNQLFNNFA